MKFAVQTITGAAIGCSLAVLGAVLFGWHHNDPHFLVCIVAGVAITHLVCRYWTGKAKELATPDPKPEIHQPTGRSRYYDNS